MSRSNLLDILHNAVVTGGGNPQMELYLRGAMQQESGGDVFAGRNKPGHSAQGLFQFMPTTWSHYGGGDIYDAATQCRNAVRMTLDSQRALADILGPNHQPNAGEFYLMHFLGQGGATKVLKADPNTPITKLVSEQAIDRNPIKFRGKSFRQFTAGDLRQWAESKMNVDISARLAYQETPDHAPEEQDAERETRRHILLDGGMKDDEIAKLDKKGDLLGMVFFVILAKMFGELSPDGELEKGRLATAAPAPAPAATTVSPSAATPPAPPVTAPTPSAHILSQLPANLPNVQAAAATQGQLSHLPLALPSSLAFSKPAVQGLPSSPSFK
jgi:hypothetical protein